MVKKKEKSELQLLCEDLEHWETEDWAARAILKKELLTYRVYDPCAGIGILTKAALEADYDVHTCDIHDWRKPGHIDFMIDYLGDFLTAPKEYTDGIKGATVFLNPPFSLAEKFVDKSFEYGARKIVCFQKFSWYEGSYDKGKKRGQWWENNRPARIWVCGDRADCWRHDIPHDKRDSSTPTAYAWFVWERGHSPAAITGHIYKGDAL